MNRKFTFKGLGLLALLFTLFTLSCTKRGDTEALTENQTRLTLASASAGGSVSGAGTFTIGSTVTATATPAAGYNFFNWTENGTAVANTAIYIYTAAANRSLVANFVATGTVTAPPTPIGPTAINLGTAGTFGILAKTAISTTGVTLITADIGVSPAAATAITGFGLVMNANLQYAGSSLVVGNIYAADYSASAAKMTTAISNMETAFNAGNTIVSPAPVVELHTGNLSGKTIAPGLYKWSTGVSVSSAGLVLNGGANDTWVFQIAQDMVIGDGAIITLTGGAQAKNVFWVVSGKATLGTTSNVKGIILSKTLISLNTGAKVTGRLLAQTAVTLDANTIVLP
ncbi:DUF3494 domain-containing protein [Pedobacter sp. MC2016-14]|uniref:ice-binding family protein n=1 Tax=Pedobacter sp. MC2016-14 TaxID=2897327 RepID=UPI001E62AA7D|nr:ice-binding family protein [Pedobacter sp. MC2016-14]MCD0486826.1 DUF3494 domain-containing protein [Pedobacter sp. MC2016-14]